MEKNQHATNVPTEVLEQVDSKIKEISELIKPYTTALNPDERRSLVKMGDKTLSFVTKANEYAGKNPEMMPVFIKKDEFDIDMADATGLLTLQSELEKLGSLVEDTRMLAGSEALSAALGFYNNVKLAVKQNVPGAEVIYNDLKQRFPNRNRYKK